MHAKLTQNQETLVAKLLKDSEKGTGPPCNFTEAEMFRLIKHFKEQAGPSNKLCKGTFRVELHRAFRLMEDVMMDRIFYAFDRDNDGVLKLEEYIWGMSAFLRGNLEDRINYCFRVYDRNKDGQISRREMFQLLKTSLNSDAMDTGEEDPDDTTKDMVEIVFKKLDSNHDGKLDFNDYKKAVYRDSLLMESLGQCLPSDDDVDKFMENLPK